MSIGIGYGRFSGAGKLPLGVVLWLLAPPNHAQTTPAPAAAAAPGGAIAAGPVKIAILGDSLAAGYGVSPAQAIPTRLEAALRKAGRNITVINHGVSGDTTAGGLARVDWMLG